MADEVLTSQDQYSILATATRDEASLRVLKQGDTFAVFDKQGDLGHDGSRELGLYHEGTRYLSKLELGIARRPLLVLNSSIRKSFPVLIADLTNPDMPLDAELLLAKGTLHVARSKFLFEATSYERLEIFNYGSGRLRTSLTIDVDSDFADVFEVRGTVRLRRGHRLPNQLQRDGLVLKYRGLDDLVRQARIQGTPIPDDITASTMTFGIDLEPGQSHTIFLTVICSSEPALASASLTYDEAFQRAAATTVNARKARCRIDSSSYQLNEWLNRSGADIDMMTTSTKYGPYPYAGIPWFSTPFGRDGIITALEMLWVDPALAKGVLRYLAATQATEVNERQDAQPGKILHEARLGEMPALGEVPFGRYYGSIDSTPLFVILAGRCYRRTADEALLRELWPHVDRALKWIDQFGDMDGDGFVEYMRESPTGLVNQGWKDSGDSISHADGRLAEPPIALCEVQGYVFGAWREAAVMAAALGLDDTARALNHRAAELQRKFDEAFWCDEIGGYALALDGRKHACCVRTSNPGHCLFTGIVGEFRARTVAEGLFREDVYSGWGIRTLSTGERRYNPMSYHNGPVWPHDNAIIAAGLARYGFKDLVLKLLTSLFDATIQVDLHRLPELFCGFSRRTGEGPTGYPLACRPQAWAAGAVFMLLEAALGIDIDAAHRQVTLSRPALPKWLRRVRIDNLVVREEASERPGGTARCEECVDLLCVRHPHDVGISVVRRRGNISVVHEA